MRINKKKLSLHKCQPWNGLSNEHNRATNVFRSSTRGRLSYTLFYWITIPCPETRPTAAAVIIHLYIIVLYTHLYCRRSRIPEPEQQKMKSSTIFDQIIPHSPFAGNRTNNVNVVRVIKTTTGGCTARSKRGIRFVRTRRRKPTYVKCYDGQLQ